MFILSLGGENLKYRGFILVLVLLSISLGVFATNAPGGEKIYVVPIKGEINRATHNYLRDVLEDIADENVAALIFEIDTYGGSVEEAQKIKDLIISTNIPTISFVNNKAISAGVLITIASEKVVMTTNSTIGSAETIPNTEKILSFWRSTLRDTAQYRGRNTQIIEGMADKDVEVDGVSKKGKLINLTSQEALELGIADLIANDVDDIISKLNLSNAEIDVLEEGLQIKLAKYISSPYISTLLLIIGFLGLVVEIMTPGFGIGGSISLLGFGLYFAGNILAGNSNWMSLLLFVLGLVLLIIEVFIPGFGLPGISGIVLVLVGTVLAMNNIRTGIMSLSIAIIIATIASFYLVKMGFKSKLFRSIILTNKLDEEKGYSSGPNMTHLIDMDGVSLSELRPAGFIEIDGEKLDALSEGEFISKNSLVKVVRVEGSKIYVRRN